MNTLTHTIETAAALPQLANTGATVTLILAIGAVAVAFGVLLIVMRGKR